MVNTLRVLLAAVFFTSSAHAELLLTPSVLEYELDGVKLKQLAFEDGAKTVTYQAPHGWTVQGGATRLTLRAPNKQQVDATITRIPAPHPEILNDEGMAKLLAQALADLPKGSVDAAVTSQEKNPLKIQGKGTFLVTLTYTLYAQQYCRSILFLNRAEDQIRSQLTCRAADFRELQQVFLASQYSWQNL
ncbi:MAG: hypothetical protein ABI992_00340 [Chthoniobacterales bacterium]